ncbi:MAG: hypothetical protein Q9210_002457 [Variospora velana]
MVSDCPKYHRGTYVDFWVGVELCRQYGLSKLEKELRTLKDVGQEPTTEPKLPDFIQITELSNPVMVRQLDLRVNASHIFKLTGHSRTTVANFRKALSPEAYEILRGGAEHQGTYVDFDVAIELCRKHGLAELEGRLYSLKHIWEKPVLEAKLSHVGPWSQPSRRLPESPGSDTVSARNESTQPRGIWNRVQQPPSLAEPITDGSIQAEEDRETDSESDGAGSDGAGPSGSVSSCEPRSIERDTQPVLSIQDSGDAAPSHQLGRDIRHSLPEHGDYRSYSTKSAQYEVWDSRPQLSGLTEVRPNLNPSTCNTFSHCGSFENDLFAPT